MGQILAPNWFEAILFQPITWKIY